VLGLLSFFLILVPITLVIKTKDTNCAVVLVVDLVSHLIEKRSSLGLSDRLREGKG
jgi:Mg2+/citrate symporter